MQSVAQTVHFAQALLFAHFFRHRFSINFSFFHTFSMQK